MQPLERLAHNNIWTTQKLNLILKNVSDEDFNKDCGLFFKSISGTLNHLLAGEPFLWFPRFKCQESPILPLSTILETNKTRLLDLLETKAHHWLDLLKLLIQKRSMAI